MAAKRTAKKRRSGGEAGPKVDRPFIQGYGIPKDKKGLLPWSHVNVRMSEALHYWISTVSPDGRPHATPVDGLWLGDRLYFGGSPQTRRNRNLAKNSAVCVHLESAMDVIILHGDVSQLRTADQSLLTQLVEASAKKYGFSPKAEDFASGGTFVFRPRKVLAWKQFPKDATRWQFEED